MYAVIKTGGKQYRVAANDTLKIEKLSGAAGDTVEFADVLMVGNGETIEFGAPFVSGAIVAAEIVGQVRGPKIIIFKKRRRKHYRRRNGHRQDLTHIRITEILTGGARPSKKEKVAAKPAEAKVKAKAEAAPLAAPVESKKADDLSLIGGVGPKILKALNEMGYTTYAQIAALDGDAIEKIETAIKMKGRIAREEWIEQAKELAAGKPPRAKVDKEAKAEKAEKARPAKKSKD